MTPPQTPARPPKKQDRPLALKQWTVTDAQGIKTQVVLTRADFDIALDPNLFALPTGKAPANRTD